MLRSALGMAIAGYLENESIVEVILSPDGQLWIDRLSSRPIATGETLPAVDGGHIVRLVAHHVGAEVDDRWPRVSAELPITDARFEDLLPPALAALAFALRKPALGCVHAHDYVAKGIVMGVGMKSSRTSRRFPAPRRLGPTSCCYRTHPMTIRKVNKQAARAIGAPRSKVKGNGFSDFQGGPILQFCEKVADPAIEVACNFHFH